MFKIKHLGNSVYSIRSMLDNSTGWTVKPITAEYHGVTIKNSVNSLVIYADSVDSTGRLTKAHIVLNTNRLTTDTAQSTLVHEIGHLFWLRDNPSATENTIMSYNRDRTTMRIPQIFDIYNVKYRYE